METSETGDLEMCLIIRLIKEPELANIVARLLHSGQLLDDGSMGIYFVSALQHLDTGYAPHVFQGPKGGLLQWSTSISPAGNFANQDEPELIGELRGMAALLYDLSESYHSFGNAICIVTVGPRRTWVISLIVVSNNPAGFVRISDHVSAKFFELPIDLLHTE